MRAAAGCTLCLLLALAQGAAAESLPLCYHYGCARSSMLQIPDAAMAWYAQRLAQAGDGAEERAALQDVVLAYYLLAAQQVPIGADRGGNHEDARIVGRMDCLDHSHNIRTLLQLLARHGWLRYHHPGDDAYRAPLLFDQHYAPTVIETDSGEVWVMDGWPRDFGAPPLVVPLALWKEGFSP